MEIELILKLNIDFSRSFHRTMVFTCVFLFHIYAHNSIVIHVLKLSSPGKIELGTILINILRSIDPLVRDSMKMPRSR